MMRSRYGLQSLIFWVEKNHDWIKNKNLDFSERHFDADNKSVAALELPPTYYRRQSVVR